MQHNFTFVTSILAPSGKPEEESTWEKVVYLYDQGLYADAVRACLRYIRPDVETKYANADRTHYKIPHGSIIVDLTLNERELFIEAPFLNIEQAKKVPLLRQAAQINFYPLSLARIDCEHDLLYFRYQCPLERCEPYKIYDILREICIHADYYDDEFITKFGAKRIQEPKIKALTPEEIRACSDHIRLFIEEAFTAYETFENKRQTTFLWDVLIITLLKIDYCCAPQGSLRSDMEKTFVFLNGKDDYYQRLSTGKDFLKKLLVMPQEELEKSLYRIEIFVPYKFRSAREALRNALKYAFETGEKELKALDYTGALLTMQYGIYNVWYNHQVEETTNALLTDAMLQASGKPVQEAAKIIYQALQQIMQPEAEKPAPAATATHSTSNPRKKSFLERIFGKSGA